MKVYAILLTLTFSLGAVGQLAHSADPEPSVEAPLEYRAFVGSWSGEWSTGLNSELTVRSVTPQGGASGRYSWSDDPAGTYSAGYIKFEGQIQNNVLTFEVFPNKAAATFELVDDGTLAAVYTSNGNVSKGKFVKK